MLARIHPTSTDLPALINALLGMTVWSVLDETTAAQHVSSERRIEAVTSVWLAAVWGVAR